MGLFTGVVAFIGSAYATYQAFKTFFGDDSPKRNNYNNYPNYRYSDTYNHSSNYRIASPHSKAQLNSYQKNCYFKAIHVLPLYLPEEISVSLFGLRDREYSTPQALLGFFKILVEAEDMEELKSTYVKLTQTGVNLKAGIINNTFVLRTDCKYPENHLIPYDDIFIINTSNPINNFVGIHDKDPNKILNLLLSKSMGWDSDIHKGNILDVSDSTRSVQFQCTSLSKDKLNDRYTIIFRSARYSYRYQYRALGFFSDPKNRSISEALLFPRSPKVVALSPRLKLTFINPKIAENEEQCDAVQRIVCRNHTTAPFMLFGPPGTGKSTTIVESILQIYCTQPGTHILVMAHSNTACNEIASRLLRLYKPLSLMRIFSRSVEKQINTIDVLLKSAQHSNISGKQYYPSVEALQKHRILVCTLSTAGKLALGDFGKKFGAPVYSYVFVDEAAACTEPEILMGLVDVVSPNVKIILSGDHKQLGPVISSKLAKKAGLGVSLMERLFKTDCYRVDEKGNYDKTNQIRLCNNFRSHPAIVKLFSHLYYDNKLKPLAQRNQLQLNEELSRMVKPKFPILFHAVYTKSQREENESSSYNEGEITTVLSYIVKLLVKGTHFTTKDIGIVSPYKAQCSRIKERLNKNKWESIECGSCEMYQGKEKRIIIASFVKSQEELGFLRDPQRLNVTISRAQDLLILIGNPITLSKSKDYKYIINQCKSHGVFLNQQNKNQNQGSVQWKKKKTIV